METGEQLLLAVLVAFALGVALGRLWTRLSARAGHETSRRPSSLHYVLGLDYLASRQIDRAVAELTLAATADTEAIELYLILGNLFREKGQLERAVQIHQSLLHRPGLAARERAHVLFCLAVDFKRAGFRRRARETFEEVLRLDPDNPLALFQLMRLHEEEQDWRAALALHRRIAATGSEAADPVLAAFYHDRLGETARRRDAREEARRELETAIRHAPELVAPRIHLGELDREDGRDDQAAASWERLARERPEEAYLVFDRLEELYRSRGALDRLERFYRDVVAANERDWRAHLALARIAREQGRADEAFRLLEVAAERNPHAVAVHLAAWDLALSSDLPPERWRELVDRIRAAVLFLDPHVCVKCHYRAEGMLWRCPHCLEWNTFVEERWTSRPAEEAPPG